MEAVSFDTHKYVKRLTAVGMPEPQAEAIADEQRSLIEGQLATKRDIKELEAATKRDIKELETALRHDLEELRRDMKEMETGLRRDLKEMEQKLTIRLGVMMTASVVTMSALAAIL